MGKINNFSETNNMTNPSKAVTMPIDALAPYHDHPLKLYDGQRLDDMVRSIGELGVLHPVIVRFYDGKYEILSGHNRVNAAKIAGLTEVPVIIKEGLSDDDAHLIVTETNLVQRSFTDLSHSERAIVLKTHMDAVKRLGKRSELISSIDYLTATDGDTAEPHSHNIKSRDITAKNYGLNNRDVSRYIRLTELIKPLQGRVDNKEIGFITGVTLSYLQPHEQEWVDTAIVSGNAKISIDTAENLRDMSKQGILTQEGVEHILCGKPAQVEKPRNVKLHSSVCSRYLDGMDNEQASETVSKALEYYFANINQGG